MYARYFRRAQRLLRESNGLFVVRNDVDLFAAQFANDGLHAHTLHADAGANRIHILVATQHRNFRALACLTSRRTNLYRTIINFRHFHLKQPLNKSRIRAGHNHLRSLRSAVHHLDDHAQALANVVRFQLGLFAFRQASFGAAHIHDQVRAFRTLHDHGNKFTHAIVVFIENRVALGFAHLLHDHLLRRLRSDPAQHIGRLRRQNLRANFRRRIFLLRVGHGNFALRVGHFLDDRNHGKHVHLARVRIKFAAQVFFRLVILPRSHNHRVFNRRHDDFRLNVLLAAEHFDLLK